MIHDLLRVKRIREKAAEDHVRTCRYRVEVAVKQLEAKEKELVEYKQWRLQEETRLYDEVMNTSVKQFDLDIIKQKVALLRQKDLTLEEEIASAKTDLQKAREELEQATQAHLLATRAVQKFEEFADVVDKETAREKARIEELELEEFTPTKRY